jgi:4-methyl-5(b-hydroxyethyl)-thiazole monophosphate biosynthesis
MKKVYIFLTDGFEEIEALTTMDVLRRGGVDIRSASMTGVLTVTGRNRIAVIADCLFEDVCAGDAAMLVLPGGTEKINEYDALKKEVVAFDVAGKPVAAICAAPMVLGGLGLLRGKRACCYPGYEKYLEGATITDTPVTVDGNFTTARGAGCTIAFALELLKQLAGAEKALEVAKQIIY